MLRSFLLGSILCSVVYATSAQIPYNHAYFNQKRVNLLGKEKKDSIKWSLQRGNRTGRTAWQFILDYASKKNLKIKI